MNQRIHALPFLLGTCRPVVFRRALSMSFLYNLPRVRFLWSRVSKLMSMAVLTCKQICLPRAASPPRELPATGPRILDKAWIWEEERLDWYSPNKFYPVRIAEIFHARYQTVGKLGYGASSTVWLCRDLMYVLIPTTLYRVPLTDSIEHTTT